MCQKNFSFQQIAEIAESIEEHWSIDSRRSMIAALNFLAEALRSGIDPFLCGTPSADMGLGAAELCEEIGLPVEWKEGRDENGKFFNYFVPKRNRYARDN